MANKRVLYCAIIVLCLLDCGIAKEVEVVVNEKDQHLQWHHGAIIACGYSTAADSATLIEEDECPNNEACNSGPDGNPMTVYVGENRDEMLFYFCDVPVQEYVKLSDACRIQYDGNDTYIGSCDGSTQCDTGPLTYNVKDGDYGVPDDSEVELWFCAEYPTQDIQGFYEKLFKFPCQNTTTTEDSTVTVTHKCHQKDSCSYGPIEVVTKGGDLNITAMYCVDDTSTFRALDLWYIHGWHNKKNIVYESKNNVDVNKKSRSSDDLTAKKTAADYVNSILENIKQKLFGV